MNCTTYRRGANLPFFKFYVGLINQDVKSLLGTGYFYNVDVSWEVKDSGIDLVYSVQGKPRLTEIRFEGNERLSDRRLKKKVSSKVGEPIDEKKLFTDAREIETFYQKKGYIVLGDEFGNLTVWNCSELMQHLDLLRGGANKLEIDEILESLSDQNKEYQK